MFQNSSEATKTMGNCPIFGTSSPYLEKCDLANRPISGSFINKNRTNLDQNSLVWKKVRTKSDFLGDYFRVEMENEKRAVFLGIVQNRAVLVPKSKALVPLPERPVVPYRPLRNIFFNISRKSFMSYMSDFRNSEKNTIKRNSEHSPGRKISCFLPVLNHIPLCNSALL